MTKDIDQKISENTENYDSVQQNFYGVMLCLASCFCFALTSILVKFAYTHDTTVPQILFFRLIIASIFIWAFVIIKGDLKKVLGIQKKYILISGLGGVFGYCVSVALSFKALQYIDPGFERILFHTYPIFVILFYAIWNRKMPSSREIITFFALQIGIYFLLKNIISDHNDILGIFFIIACTFVWSFFMIITQYVCRKVGSLAYVFHTMTFATIFMSIYFLITQGIGGLNISKELFSIFLVLGLICTFIPHLLSSESTKIIGASRCSLLSVCAPFLTIIISYFTLNETMTWYQMLGAIIVVSALIFLESDIKIIKNKVIDLKLLEKIKISKEYKIFFTVIICYLIVCYMLIGLGFIKFIKIQSFVVFTVISLTILGMFLYWFYHYSIIPTINQLIISKLKAENSEKKTKELLETRTKFFGNMNHELKTPLIAILGFTESIKLRENNNKETHQDCKQITAAGEHLTNLINNVLNISKQTSLKQDIISLNELINLSLELSKTKINKKKNLDIIFINTHKTDYTLKADKEKLKQIFLNLLFNSVQYTDKGKVEIILEKDKQQNITIKVKDTGIGIRKDDLSKALQEYSRTIEGTERGQGMGLGLPIAKQLIESHGFKFHIKSTYKQGTEITITIPKQKIIKETLIIQKEINKPKPQTQQTSIEQPKLLFPNKKILLVDDNHVNLLITEKLLKRTVTENIIKTAEGNETLGIIQKEKPDLVFMDENLGINKTGSEIVGELKTNKKYSKYKNIPVIMLTADTLKDDVERIMSTSKAEGYAEKPFKIENIIELIKKLVK